MAEVSIQPTGKQHKAWQALRTNNIVYMGGGAGGGKKLAFYAKHACTTAMFILDTNHLLQGQN